MSRRRQIIAIILASACALQIQLCAEDAPAFTEIKTSFDSGDKKIEVERFEPKTAGKHPAVLLIHGADGFTLLRGAYYYGIARELAKAGYVVVIPHYFDKTDTKFADPIKMFVNFMPWAATVKESIAYTETLVNVDKEKLGLCGVSLGSFLSLSIACEDTRIKAVVENFGGQPGLWQNFKQMPPTLILHGKKDFIVSVNEAYKIEKMFKEKGTTYEMKIYGNQGHGFLGADGEDSTKRTIAWFDKYLKGASTAEAKTK